MVDVRKNASDDTNLKIFLVYLQRLESYEMLELRKYWNVLFSYGIGKAGKHVSLERPYCKSLLKIRNSIIVANKATTFSVLKC